MGVSGDNASSMNPVGPQQTLYKEYYFKLPLTFYFNDRHYPNLDGLVVTGTLSQLWLHFRDIV